MDDSIDGGEAYECVFGEVVWAWKFDKALGRREREDG